jgi:hypothetical protein
MKQNAEARLAELTEERLKYVSLEDEIKSEVNHQEQDLQKSERLDEYHRDYLNFEKWKRAQHKKIKGYQEEGAKLTDAEKEIKRELAELIVKEAHFKKILKASFDQRKLTNSQLESERSQNIWLQSKQ